MSKTKSSSRQPVQRLIVVERTTEITSHDRYSKVKLPYTKVIPASQFNPATDRLVLNPDSPNLDLRRLNVKDRTLAGYAYSFPGSNLDALYNKVVDEDRREELRDIYKSKQVVQVERLAFDYLSRPEQEIVELIRKQKDVEVLWNWFLSEHEDLPAPRPAVQAAFEAKGFGPSPSETTFVNGRPQSSAKPLDKDA